MIVFINSYTLKNLKIKLLVLYILNVLDIIFTILLLNTGYFIEVNIFMVKVVESSIASWILKIFFVGFLLCFLYQRMKSATKEQLEYSNLLLNSILCFYIGINILHLFNICLFFKI